MLGVASVWLIPERFGALNVIEVVDDVTWIPLNVATPDESVTAVTTPLTPVPDAVTVTPAALTALPEPSRIEIFGCTSSEVAAVVGAPIAMRSIASSTPVLVAT